MDKSRACPRRRRAPEGDKDSGEVGRDHRAAGVGGSARLHRSPHSFDARWPDSFTAPGPTPEPRARYAPALAGSRDPPRTCARRAGTPYSGSIAYGHAVGGGPTHSACRCEEPPPTLRSATANRNRYGVVHTATAGRLWIRSHHGPSRISEIRGARSAAATSMFIHSRAQPYPGDRPRQRRYGSICPPGLAVAPPEDVSSTRRGSRPRSSKRGTV